MVHCHQPSYMTIGFTASSALLSNIPVTNHRAAKSATTLRIVTPYFLLRPQWPVANDRSDTH